MTKMLALLALHVLMGFFSAKAFPKNCDESIVAYNSNYSKQTETSDARTLFNTKFLKFLSENTSPDIKNLAYYLSTKLFHPQSNDDNFFELSEILKSGKPLNPDDDSVVRGHSLIRLSGLSDSKDLKEIAKFLYIQVFTNSDLKRARANLNDLTDCSPWHIFYSPKL